MADFYYNYYKCGFKLFGNILIGDVISKSNEKLISTNKMSK